MILITKHNEIDQGDLTNFFTTFSVRSWAYPPHDNKIATTGDIVSENRAIMEGQVTQDDVKRKYKLSEKEYEDKTVYLEKYAKEQKQDHDENSLDL